MGVWARLTRAFSTLKT